MPSAMPKVVLAVTVALLGFTVAFTALGAVGTTCVAWSAEKWGPFAVLVPFKWLYQILVYFNFAAAVGGIFVTYAVLKGKTWSYVGSIVTLLIFMATAVVQMHYTSMLRNVPFFSTPPTSIRFYITVIVFAFFLVLKVPRIWGEVGFIHPASGTGSFKSPAGLSLIVAGVTALTTFFWAGASHTVEGYNLVRVLEIPVMLGGGTILLTGVGLLALASLPTRPSPLMPTLQDVPPVAWLKHKKP